MKRKIVEIERSPFNRKYFLKLECGHRLTYYRSPGDVAECKECQPEPKKKAK